MSDELRRNMPLFPISIVMKLTDLSARQIRYYEQHGLIKPARTKGNRRIFSFNDVERLLEIKDLIEKGVNIAGIQQMIRPVTRPSDQPVNITPQTEAVEETDALLKTGTAQQPGVQKINVHQKKGAIQKKEAVCIEPASSHLRSIIHKHHMTGMNRRTKLLQGELARFFKQR